jgi:hypothetical protein
MATRPGLAALKGSEQTGVLPNYTIEKVAGLSDIASVTASSDEINIMDGVTATAAEINKVAGVTAGTAAASKALVLGANKNVDTLAIAEGGLKIGAAAGTAVTATAAELNTLAGVTAGAAAASKGVVLGADVGISGLLLNGLLLGVQAHDYGGGNVAWTLSATEEKKAIITTTNAATGSCDIIALPTAGKVWIVKNTSGQANVIKATGQTGITIANGKTAIVMGNGTDFLRVTADS